MYARHFLKMFLALVFMGIIGIAGLVIANHYSKTGDSLTTPSSDAVTSSDSRPAN